jgi:hypothetical protein
MRQILLTALVTAAASVAACSPGTLPGSPSPVLVAGGGGRYNGSITYRRLGGNFTISEASQQLDLSLLLRDVNQISGRFQTAESSGTVQGVLSGDMANGTLDATVLVQSTVRQGAGGTCEGRGQIAVTLSGVNLSWTGGSITYDNCPGLTVTSEARAVAVSPIPDSSGTRAQVVVNVLGGAIVPRGTCPAGGPGYPFTVEISERAGVNVNFDSTFRVEERRSSGATSSSQLDMPFASLNGGSRRTYGACSPVSGTYQAFFSGTDGNGNRLRVASPVVTLAP